MEQFPNLENQENKSLEEKHNAWLKEARIALEGVGFHVGVGVSTLLVLKGFGVDLPPEIVAAIAVVAPTPSTIGFMAKRREGLNKE